jgi:hypothetical protein
MTDKEMEKVEILLETPYWIIDILPKQVPKDSAGQYFAIENYWRQEPHRSLIAQKHLNVVLKLNCYMDICIGDGQVDPAPEILRARFMDGPLNILIGDALLTRDPDDTYMTVYNADEDLLRLIKTLAAAEGLFVWQPHI